MRLTHRWGFIENGVEGAVFLFVFLNEMQVLAPLTAYARNAQRRKQAEFQHSFARDKRLIRDRRAGEQEIILSDHPFDIVAASGKEAWDSMRTCGEGQEVGIQELEIPDACVHSHAVVIN